MSASILPSVLCCVNQCHCQSHRLYHVSVNICVVLASMSPSISWQSHIHVCHMSRYVSVNLCVMSISLFVTVCQSVSLSKSPSVLCRHQSPCCISVHVTVTVSCYVNQCHCQSPSTSVSISVMSVFTSLFVSVIVTVRVTICVMPISMLHLCQCHHLFCVMLCQWYVGGAGLCRGAVTDAGELGVAARFPQSNVWSL